MKNKIQILIEDMVRDLEELISSKYPTKEVEIRNVEIQNGVAQLSFSIGRETSFTIDVNVN